MTGTEPAKDHPGSRSPWPARGRTLGTPGLAAAGLFLVACMQAQPVPATPSTTTLPPETTTTASPPRDCSPELEGPVVVPEQAAAFSLQMSRAMFPCAEEVVLASADAASAWTGATLAAVKDGPLLLVDGAMSGEIAAELRRLEPETVYLVGLVGIDRSLFGGYKVAERPPREARPYVPEITASNPNRVWLILGDSDGLSAVAWAAAHTNGDALIVARDPDPRRLSSASRELLAALPLITVGEVTDDFAWQLAVVEAGAELPGGGQIIFGNRRLVALYGNPTTRNLGVLGHQGPEEAVARLEEIAEPYSADGLDVMPAFEIIATVASAIAGRDGNYSEEMSLDVLRPWIEVAADHGVYVILDLQPGRTDFLTQAKHYEEFLRLPHVGLALDPEWRLKPNQVHLRQVGTVDAAEINQVSAWLAGIVREEALPQKLLLLHQFKLTMITNRALIETPSELAVVVQMDGQGPLATKYSTWNAITVGTENAGWLWGWKNFYDEDAPMATPSEVLDLEPKIVYVSFQ